MPKGSPPDFTLWAANDHGKGKCGAAWKNEDGTISIVLDQWAIIRGRAHAGGALTVMLYPPDSQRNRPQSGINPKAADKAGQRDDLEDDIPF